jgi:16S rRNA (guanine527-N7)-methyltransferase
MSDLVPDPARLPEQVSVLLERGAAVLTASLGPEQRERLYTFLVLLARWNRTYNLTAVRDPTEMVTRHLLDSLAVLPYLSGESVLDLGTGPGLPGLPLAICDPRRHYCLLDANGKKIRFVRHAALELGLTNVEVVQSRIEAYRPGRKFSTIVSRAVAAIAAITPLAAPLLKSPGRLLVMKGRYPQDELLDPTLSGLDLVVHRLSVPSLQGERHLIEIRRD